MMAVFADQLEAGHTLTVTEVEFEAAIERVSMIERRQWPRTVTVPIYLKPKPDPSVPKSAVDLYHKGQEAARSGNHKKAAEFFNEALAASPNFQLALGDLGVEYLKLGDMAKVVETREERLK